MGSCREAFGKNDFARSKDFLVRRDAGDSTIHFAISKLIPHISLLQTEVNQVRQFWKRALSALLAVVFCLSLVPAVHVHAVDEDQPSETGVASSSYEPWKHGYRFVDILNFDPENDPWGEEMVASVPLQERNDTFAATQANPELTDQAKLYVISSGNYRSTDVNEAPWNANMSYDEFSYNLFKFWQYTDIVGAGGRPTSGIAVGSADKEYGIVAIPNPATTNAAHKNGVISLGEYFCPRSPQYTEEWLYKDEDGNFPYAQKLIDIMNYYGFDGYFINQEENISSDLVPLFREMLQWMCEQGAYIQWYDSITGSGSISYQNAFNSANSGWVLDEDLGRVTDSIFLNYWYSSTALRDSKAYAESLGLDPYEVVFMGVEGGQWDFNVDIESRYNCIDENGQPYTSFAIWGSDFYHEQYHKPDGRYQVGYQWEAEERERMYFTSATENAGDYDTTGLNRSDVGVASPQFRGFSKYVVEKSVINGSTFATDFNNGHGMQYFVNGQVSRDMEWTNLNLQDILPTWQWWVRSTDDNQLELDWDYGEQFYRYDESGETYAFPYTQVGAYNGGSSLAIYGDVQGSQLVSLYKTNLDITANSELALTYNKVSADDASTMQVALIFEDDPENVVYVPVTGSGNQTEGWTTVTLPLGSYAGRKLAAMGLEFSAPELVTGYQVNLGRLAITDGADYTPAAPTGLALAKRFDGTGEIQLTWDLGDYDSVKLYRVYAGYADGTERFVGGVYGDNYYIQTLEDADNVTGLKVRAVGADGSESEAAVVNLAQDNRVSNILTVSRDNALTVTWTEPAGDFANVEVSLSYWYNTGKADPAPVTVAKGAGTASLPVDLEDGSRYILTVTTVNADGTKNEPVSYFGEVADNYCAPYAGSARVKSNGRVNLTTPEPSDWLVAYIEQGGVTNEYRRFGGSKMQNLSVNAQGLTLMVITLEDMDGNVSAPTTIMFIDGQVASPDAPYGEEMVPDPVLRQALIEKVGPTVADLLDYQGALDLSGLDITDLTGLTLLTGLTELNLSGTSLTTVTAGMLPAGLTLLDLSGCESLTEVELNDRPNLAVILDGCTALTDLSLVNYGDHALDLSDCVNLLNLDLTGTRMQALDIRALVQLHNFSIADSQIATLTAANAARYTNAYYWVWDNAKLDLTEETAEGQLMAGLKDYFATTELPDEVGDESVRVGSGYLNSWSSVGTINLNGSYLLDTIVVDNPYSDWGWYDNLTNFTVEVSTDGQAYTQVAQYEGITDATYTATLPEGTRAAYVRLSTTDTNCYASVTVYGYPVAPKGFTYGGQQPAMERDGVQPMTVTDDGTVYQTLDLLNASYASTRLVNSGVPASTLTGADWIDQAYLEAAYVMPTGVRVTILGPDGQNYVIPTEGPTLGDLDTENKLEVTNVIASAENSGEEGANLFDGLTGTKWCTGGPTGYVGFELTEPKVVGQWYTLHAGSESSSMITAGFRLQVLNQEMMTDEEYVALSESEKGSVLRDAGYWTDLDVVTGNSENEVTREIGLENLVSAQVYRFYVDEYTQPGAQYGAIRVYEMALYGYTGQLGADTNGYIQADEIGDYQVTYERRGEVLATTTVTVEHDIQDWQLIEAATCTEEGLMRRICANCGYDETITLAPLGHRLDEGVVTKEPTCTEEGEITYTCSVCGETVVESIAKADHSYVAAVTAPTCETLGYTTYTCSVCGDSYVTGIVPATGHNYESVVTAPTCDRMGYTTHTCTVCGDTYVDSYTDATDHEFQQTVTKEATCTEEGVMTFTCIHEGCTEVYTQPIPKAGHDCATTVVASTCLSYGYTEHKCRNCGFSYITDVTYPLGHDYVAEVTEPTYENGGYTTHTCSRCGDSYVDSYTDALVHKCAAFTDIAGHWGEDAICFVTERDLFNGMSETIFAPEGKMNRAMVVMVLYRMAGSPAVEGELPFTDVPTGAYYDDALYWAYTNGIAEGVTDTLFRPTKDVTREQLVTFLYRYAEFAGMDVSGSADLTAFADGAGVSGYARPAMAWAVNAGLINGVGNNTLAPQSTATRAQFAATVQRLVNLAG